MKELTLKYVIITLKSTKTERRFQKLPKTKEQFHTKEKCHNSIGFLNSNTKV